MRNALLPLMFLVASVAQADMTFRQSTLPARYSCVPPSGFGNCNRTVNLNVGEYLPSQTVVGDILYLHGFADAFSNHLPLFREWTDAGFRVIAFDYPGHGVTRTLSKISIDSFNFEGLMDLAHQVERRTRQDANRPLLLAGWSTGGLLAIRMVQDGNLATFGRRPEGMMLFAPGVAVNVIVGRQSWRYPLGEVTFDTLTHNRDVRGLMPPKPRSPGSVPFFAGSILYNSKAATSAKYPAWLPTLVIVAGDKEDKYVPSKQIKTWVKRQAANVHGVQCPTARHWLDNELPEHGGDAVKAAAKTFAEAVITRSTRGRDYSGKACFQFR